MKFTKMHGLGNDYLYHYGELENARELSIRYSNRHTGIGSDGIITISDSDIADYKMRIFNADGSEAMMCGNGIRCVGKYVYDKGYTNQTTLTIETRSGIKTLDLTIQGGKVSCVNVDMGEAKVGDKKILELKDHPVSCIPVSMGNPHAVIFVNDAEKAPVDIDGPIIEKHPDFPDGVNVEFVSIVGKNHLRMRVWERGSGITMACGTGACAAASAAVSAGVCAAGETVTVDLDGGTLQILVSPEYQVEMIGPAAYIGECEV